MPRPLAFALVLALLAPIAARAQPPTAPPIRSVAELLDAHDRQLMRDLAAYAEKNPKAPDVDRAVHDLV